MMLTEKLQMNTYENLQIVQSQFFTNKLIFIFILSNFKIHGFISIQIRYKQRAIWLHLTNHNIQPTIR
jgi:hypothetical protein